MTSCELAQAYQMGSRRFHVRDMRRQRGPVAIDARPVSRDPYPLDSLEDRAAAFRQWLTEQQTKVAA
jgi:hypothetical protein